MTDRRYTDLALIRRCFAEARPYWPHIISYSLVSLIATPIALLGPLPLKIAVDCVLGEEPLPELFRDLLPAGMSGGALLVFAAGLMVAIAVVGQLQRLGGSWLYTRTGEKLVVSFRARLFRHVQRLSLLFHDRTESAESAYRVLWDGAAIRHVALDGVMPFVTAGFTLGAMFYVIFRLDAELAIVALVVAPIVFALSRTYRGRLRGRWRRVKRLESRGLSVVQEVLTAIRVVKAFGQESREDRRFLDTSGAGAEARVRATLAADAFGLLVALTLSIGTAIVLVVGVRHVLAGVLTLGDLLVVMVYLGQLYGPLQTISKNVGGMQTHLASIERAFALLDETPDVVERPRARRVERCAGRLSLCDVSFGYSPGRTVLEGISLEVAAGSRVGIVGPTGAGKSTLVSLLVRFYDPSTGAILLDGVDLRDYRVADLRNQYAVVPQEPLLFSTRIVENIAYARPDASWDEIVAAAAAADAHEFIQRLPQGYHTVVGERGTRLSGGERQRVALARAFLKDAPIIILDEPTSSVDVDTERTILDAMHRLMQGRTAFLIAHRASTLVGCDLLVRLADGRLTEVSPYPAEVGGPRLEAWSG
jgi:ATP-binding cassette subfamily B protein